MLIDMIELPNRYMASDDHLETALPRFINDGVDSVEWYGRKVPIDVFAEDKVRKYKTIESDGTNTIERIFLIADEIDMNKSFWTSNQKVYPVQAKFFNIQDPMIGRTIKYVNGISEFSEEFFNAPVQPVMLVDNNSPVKMYPFITTNPYNVIIPSLDITLIDSSIMKNVRPKIPRCDTWLKHDNTLSDIANILDSRFKCHQALSVLSKDQLFDLADELCNTSPIDYSWSTYELISKLNDLAVSDIRIEVNGYTNEINVAFGSRYSGLFDYSHVPGYDQLCNELIKMTQAMLRDRFKETAWTRVVIEKDWTEELFMTVNVQCPGRSSSIETFYYVDLVAFMLGTVGLI